VSCSITFGPKDSTAAGESFQIGTNTGAVELAEWATSLDPTEYPDLTHLFNEGWTDDVHLLQRQISDAIEAKPPSPDVLKSARHLMELCVGRGDDEVATIEQ
jgi:hypothetical protein